MEVNIEKIMDDIRAEIKDKGYTSDMLSFSDVTGKSSFHGNGEEEADLADSIGAASSLAMVPFDRPITGNPIAVFIKKVIRKLIRFYIRPIVEHQNEFNAHTVRALTAAGQCAVGGERADAAELSKKVELLELQLETVKKENEQLRARLDRLEESASTDRK